MKPEIKDEVYPNSKLESVHFEVRFFSLLEIDSNINTFQKVIRDTFPIYRVAKIYKNDPNGVQEDNEHQFSPEDGKLLLKITKSNLTFTTMQYTKFEEYKRDILNLIRSFLSSFPSINQFLFIGMRYINRFDFNCEENDAEKVINRFNVKYDTERIKRTPYNSFRLDERYKIMDNNFKRLFVFVLDPVTKSYAVIIDLDSSYNEKKIEAIMLEEKMKILHENIKLEFENIITDKIRDEVLRREKNVER